ncbi:MAG: hypothetical protein ACXW09_14070 [Methylococcaceae bacterium]
MSACDSGDNNSKPPKPNDTHDQKDPHITKDNPELKDDPKTLSPPILVEPLYACAGSVVVKGFIPGAKMEIFADGNPIGGGESDMPTGQTFKVSPELQDGQIITATQTFGGFTSNKSEPITVRSHTLDYPNGVPAPSIDPPPLYNCGKQTAVRGVVPGSELFVYSETPQGGGFGPPQTKGHNSSSGANQAVGINPAFVTGDRITSDYRICAEKSPVSAPLIVENEPAAINAPTLGTVYEGGKSIVVHNTLHGAVIEVTDNGVKIGEGAACCDSATLRLDPPAVANHVLKTKQTLCQSSPESPGVVVRPCSDLPPAKIKPPQAGDDRIVVTDYVPGSRILIFAGMQEVGDGGGDEIQLVRPLKVGEIITVVQILGECRSQWVYQITVECKIQDAISNPSGSGNYAVGKADYSLPAVNIGGVNVRLWATVRYPSDKGSNNKDAPLAKSPNKFPLVLFLHGNHGVSRIAQGDVCPFDGHNPEVQNHAGYNYILESLAKGGFIAVSINANDLNCLNDMIPERGVLILRHLGLWKTLNDPGQVDPVFNGKFNNRVDLARVGLAGHSRGGEAVVNAALQSNDPDIKIKSVLSIAPVDAHSYTLLDIPLLMLLPAADGDVWDNRGARIYDRAKKIAGNGWFKSQMYIYGTCHNFFNTEWLVDEGQGPDRLTRADQEAMLKGWSRAFFELTLMDKKNYLPAFTGDGYLTGLKNDVIYPSYQSANARVIDDYQQSPSDKAKNSLGGTVADINFQVFNEFEFSQNSGANIYNDSFYHDTSGLVAVWGDNASKFTTEIPAASENNAAYPFLSFRVAQVNDAKNSQGVNMNIVVGMQDSNGHMGAIESNAIGAIPYPYQHNFGAKTMMRTLRIPTACLADQGEKPVSTEHLRSLLFDFKPMVKGAVAMDQIEFSE